MSKVFEKLSETLEIGEHKYREEMVSKVDVGINPTGEGDIKKYINEDRITFIHTEAIAALSLEETIILRDRLTEIINYLMEVKK